MKLAVRIALLIFSSVTFVNAQGGRPPNCDVDCGGGTQPPGTGGGPIQTMTSVGNQRGTGGPGVTTQPAGKSINLEGSQSYTYGVPIFGSIPGRGLNMNLVLYYNSLVWQFNSDNNSMVYAADFQLSPGFTLGYGEIDFSSDLAVGILTEPTGAKHLLVPTAFPTYRTTDSTYIQVVYPTTAGGPVVATFKDGLKATYQPFVALANQTTKYRATQIEDTNGNFISITYENPNDLNISSITDTVGRVFRFTYDSTGKMLQSIGQLDGNGNVFRQYTFSWAQNQPLTFNFTRRASTGLGLPPGFMTSGQSQMNFLTKVTKPDGTSVAFDYGYGTGGNPDWGIVKTITELSSSGATRATTNYVFPAASAGALTANPTYAQQTYNDTVNTKTWTYASTVNANGLVTSMVITDPCGNTLTTTFSSAGDAIDGMPIAEVFSTTQSPTLPPGVMSFGGCPATTARDWRTVNKAWTTDSDGSNPKLQTITSILEDGTTESQVKFNSYDAFGQPTDTSEYNLGSGAPGPLVKEVITTYASLGNGIASRPSRVTVKDGNQNVVSRTDFNYDEYSVVGIADISPNPTGHDPAFTSSKTVRGNLTSTTSYAGAAAGTGGITSTYTYDAAGNRLTSKGGCCTISQQNFSSTTNYAYPDSVVAGPSGNSLSLTTSFTYNLLTGTLATAKDSNGQAKSYTYDVDERLIKTTFPDLSTVSQAYDDSSASPSITLSNSFNSLVSVTTANGPVVTQQTKNGTTLVSTKNVSTDVLDRPISVSNPFGPNETPVYTTYAYDPLGRVTQVTPPGNMGSSLSSYGIESTSVDGAAHMIQTVISTDAAGKQRKRYIDSQGLRQVDEPGETGGVAGSGSVSIFGTEGSVSVQNGGGATAGTGSVSVSGSERSTVILTHAATQASVSVTIGGSEVNNNHSSTVCTGGPPSRLPPTCHTITSNPPDAGTVQFSVTVSGTTFGPYSVSYGATSTTSSLAAALAGAFPANGLVTLSYGGGSSFTLTTTAASSAMNSSTLSTSVATSCVPSFIDNGTGGSSSTNCNGPGWTITPSQNFAGGSDNVNTTFYDTGAVTASVTINSTVYSKSSSYGQNSTAGSIASDLASQINSDTTLDKLLIASAAGGVLSLTTTATGAGTADPLSVTSATNSQYFAAGSTSFPVVASGATLTPGQNGIVYDAGTVTVSITGFTATPYTRTVNYSQGSTGSSIASSLAGAFNSDSVSPVTASASGAGLSLTAKTLGADTNYGVQVTSTTTQRSYFSQASFSGSAVSLSGGQDSVASLSTALSTYYNYDVLGNLIQVNQGQQNRIYARDNLGRLTSSTLPETANQTTTFTYTDFGSVSQKTDARGIVTTYSYDVLDRLNKVTYSDSSNTQTYAYGGQGAANFGAGQLTQVADASGTTAFQYDLMGRPSQTSMTIAGQTYVTGYTYAAGQVSKVTYPSGRTVNFTADAIGRPSQIGSNGTTLLTVGSYNAAGEVLGATYGNGMAATYTYNSQLQLATLVSGSTSAPVLNLTYNYGSQDNGQIQSIIDGITGSQSTSYIYDELGRLKSAQTNDQSSPNTWKLKFRYDRYGNRLAEIPAGGTASMPFSEISVDPSTNRIVGFQYDPAGNVTNDGFHSYTYNENNQLTQVDGAGSYVYDAGGRRVIKNGTVYIYEHGKVIAEYASGAVPASPNVEYVYGGGSLLASFASGATTYYYSDHLSIRASADASGHVMGRQTQFPFGEMMTGLQSGTTTKWQFSSYERDLASGDSGLDYAEARFYGSRSGRFYSIDPMSGSAVNPQTLNKYAYVTNDPINFTDKTGKMGGNFGCLLDNFGNCVGGNGYRPGQGTPMDDFIDDDFFFSDPFGPWMDPTAWDPLAEGEARYVQDMNQALYAAAVESSSSSNTSGGDDSPNVALDDMVTMKGGDTRPCTAEENDGADDCVHADPVTYELSPIGKMLVFPWNAACTTFLTGMARECPINSTALVAQIVQRKLARNETLNLLLNPCVMSEMGTWESGLRIGIAGGGAAIWELTGEAAAAAAVWEAALFAAGIAGAGELAISAAHCAMKGEYAPLGTGDWSVPFVP